MPMRAALLAHPAGHSLSPVMHNAAFAHLGIDATYEAWDVPPERLAEALERLRQDDMLGANVTVPHKTAVMDGLDRLTDRAQAVGAVNLIVRDGNELVGENQDTEGFLRSLEVEGVTPAGKRVALLGAGGAARAIGWALVHAGCRELRIWNRTAARAEELASSLRVDARDTIIVSASQLDDLRDSDLWIQTTTLGMRKGGQDPDTSPVPGDGWRSLLGDAIDPVAVDIVYRPLRTPFLRSATSAGMQTINGSGMLLYQGAAAFEAWTGKTAPVDVMRKALHDALEDES